MENLQVQRKKMSLANIEGRLTLEEMENVMAGSMSPCTTAIIGGTLAGIGLLTSVAGGPFTIGLGFAGFMWEMSHSQGACS